MKHESDKKPLNNYEIENIKDGRCDVVFFDLNSIEERQETSPESEETSTIYTYLAYRIRLNYSQSLLDRLKNNYEEMLEQARNAAYSTAAENVRQMRNKLLNESDKEVALDRYAFEFPTEITMTNIIQCLKSLFETFRNIKENNWSKYRQELRDITKQSGFPFDVKFPEKPKDTK